MKYKFIFLSIFLFAFAVATPLTHIKADDVIIGEDSYFTPTYDLTQIITNIVVPGMIAEGLSKGERFYFFNNSGYQEIVDYFTDFIIDNFTEIDNAILNNTFQFQNNSITSDWNPSIQNMFDVLNHKYNDSIKLSDSIDPPIIPEYDPDYTFYINYLNPPFFTYQNTQSPVIPYVVGSFNDYSYIATSVSWGSQGSSPTYFYNSTRAECMSTTPFSVYINFQDNKWYVTHSSFTPVLGWKLNNTSYYYGVLTGGSNNWSFNGSQNIGNINSFNFSYLNGNFNSLTDAFNFVIQYYSNVDIYVNGNPWLVVSAPGYVQISENTYITNTNTPIEYSLPDNTKFDYVRMKNYIISAINNSGVLKFEDIEDCFVDIDNDQTAIYTVEVLRNDFDNMFEELYSPIYYPKFSVDTQIQPDIQNGVTIINNAVGIIPDDILKVLVYGCSITLFAFLIKKLIE